MGGVLDMTIQDIIAEQEARHRDRWPQEIIGLTIGLSIIRYTKRTEKEQEQYRLLRDWLVETVKVRYTII